MGGKWTIYTYIFLQHILTQNNDGTHHIWILFGKSFTTPHIPSSKYLHLNLKTVRSYSELYTPSKVIFCNKFTAWINSFLLSQYLPWRSLDLDLLRSCRSLSWSLWLFRRSGRPFCRPPLRSSLSVLALGSLRLLFLGGDLDLDLDLNKQSNCSKNQKATTYNNWPLGS